MEARYTQTTIEKPPLSAHICETHDDEGRARYRYDVMTIEGGVQVGFGVRETYEAALAAALRVLGEDDEARRIAAQAPTAPEIADRSEPRPT